ncbi:Uncharacterised protein [Mycolicibacterium vanbaalenii]|uniref:Helix-turn-helix domain-containing protein n=1 Tax=Mycolicibacterium vanbaalenii TaxID=110539 RepID=A0A5S9R651_MYCVN|nr:hypothetical protein [Mycolicibacterium vanbaalenii]CAA0129265.1 Uncharacterised protein [Mycolicibacterium vanbaalenii]
MPKTTPPTSVAAIVTEHGIAKRTVIAAIERGDLKAEKLPGRTGAYVIQHRDVEKWIAKREAKASV